MVSIGLFRQELSAQLGRASAMGLLDVLINAGELHRAMGGAVGGSESMPACCIAMAAEISPSDIVLLESTSGPGMTVRYSLPRKPLAWP